MQPFIKPVARVTLRRGREQSIQRRHPWVFSGAIQHIDQPDALVLGDWVEVFSSTKEPLGIGFYEGGSIAIRLMVFAPYDSAIDMRQLFTERLQQAYAQRRNLHLVSPLSSAYRLTFGESDGLPGLVIDVYGSTAVTQCHSAGIFRHIRLIADILTTSSSMAINEVYDKSSSTLPQAVVSDYTGDGYLVGDFNGDIPVATENGISFYPDWLHGQKTGFFLDQRPNRAMVEQYARGKRVLNLFCYSGGFSLYALRGGADKVDSVDSSSRAIDLCDQNIKLLSEELQYKHLSIESDAFKYLEQVGVGEYDLMVVDPPAFAKKRSMLRNGLNGYRKLNAAAIKKVAKGGIIFTFSCSQAVSRADFTLAVMTAAVESGRDVQIVAHLGQSADHPVSIYYPESEYLKGLMLIVN